MSDWIEWQGGECPVPKGTLVDVRHRDGDEYFRVPAGVTFANDWGHDHSDGDILAYRICEPVKHPVPDWKHAPEWAQFCAMDGDDNTWWWYSHEPNLRQGDRWATLEGRVGRVKEDQLTPWGDQSFTWENSLIARPVDDLKRMEELRELSNTCVLCNTSRQELSLSGVGYVQKNGELLCNRCSSMFAHTNVDATAQQSALDVQIGGGHYKDLKIQPVEYMHANNIPFIEGCCIKYLTRWRDKGGIQDLEKVKHFVDLLIDLETRANKSTASGDNK